MFKVGIVGADGLSWKAEQEPRAKDVIEELLFFAQRGYKLCRLDWNARDSKADRDQVMDGIRDTAPSVDVMMVSGGCTKGGVDAWAKEKADELGIPTEIHPAEHKGWNDATLHWYPGDVMRKGYRSRNIDIVTSIPKAPDGVLFDIEPVLETGKELTLEIFGRLMREHSRYGRARFDLETLVKHTEADAKALGRATDNQSGTPVRIENRDGYNWLVYDWGWGVRIDAITEWRAVNRSGGTWTHDYVLKMGKEAHQIVIE
jgi:hypothetical protein